MTSPPARVVVIEREFAHPPERLWRALTQPHLMGEWLMANDFALAVGYGFTLKGGWGGEVRCRVLAIEPLERLSYSWDFADADPARDLRSVVTFTLTPTATGTLLRMEQAGFGPEQKQAFGGAFAGWKLFLARLAELLPDIA